MARSKLIRLLSVFVCVLHISPYNNCYYTVNDTNSLLRDKLTDYNKNTRPTINQSQPTVVGFEFDLGYIKEFDEVQQRLELLGFLKLQWTDELMKWNPADYGGMYTIVTESGPFWKPNLIMTNSAEKAEKLGDNWQTIRFVANGSAYYQPYELFTSVCAADITLYPLDIHYCYLNFLPQGYLPNEMYLALSRKNVGTTFYKENGAWDLIDSAIESVISPYFSYVNVGLVIERKSRYVIFNVIVPIIFMSFLNILVFLIPPDSGERISYSITVLLAIAVFLTVVGDNLPKTSSPMSHFSYFVMTMLVTSVCITMSTIVNLRIYNSDDSEPVKGCLATIVTSMRRICVRKQRRDIMYSRYNAEKFRHAYQNGSVISHKNELNAHESATYGHVPGVYLADTDTSDIPEPHTVKDSTDADNNITWKDVSVAFDKFFFVFFSTVVFAATVVYVVIISTSGRVRPIFS